jgi:hypothetical protein
MSIWSNVNIVPVGLTALGIVVLFIVFASMVFAGDSEMGTAAAAPDPVAADAPVTEQTGMGMSWLGLLLLVPLTGFVMYYYGFVAGR